MPLLIKRAYEPPEDQDGKRVLVDRLWPRGLSKAHGKIDVWLKDIAPSTALRQWFQHEEAKWPEFQRRYLAELQENPCLDALKALAGEGRVTLIYAAHDERHNNAVVLRDLLAKGTDR
ncbi:MAG: DUF488 domain-containing protein [Pigmentiphaga sp.]|nr:DUF488 domain-containing protein [Pigmentiphaga sp.]